VHANNIAERKKKYEIRMDSGFRSENAKMHQMILISCSGHKTD
jgi:hypothetical protein